MSAFVRRRAYRSAPALIALLLGACASSPPVEFYSLAPVQGAPVEGPTAGTAAAAPLQIVRVHVSPSLDRREMVRRSGAYGLKISDRHRWSAPLDQMIQRALSEDLLEILPSARVVLPDEPAPPGTLKIVIDIVRFAPDSAGRVSLQASWSALPDGGTATQSAIVNITVPMASMSYADQARAMSEALGQLAGRIVRRETG